MTNLKIIICVETDEHDATQAVFSAEEICCIKTAKDKTVKRPSVWDEAK